MPHVRHAVVPLFLAGITAMAMALGCSATPDDSEPAPLANPHEISPAQFAAVFKESGLLLRDRGFIVDRQDLRAGLITTRPRISPTYLEPWNATNTTSEQVVASTISNQRRIVRIWIRPTGEVPPTFVSADSEAPQTQPDPQAQTQPATDAASNLAAYPSYAVRVEVFVERAQQPNRRLSGSMNSGSAFNDLKDVPTEYKRRGIEGFYWEPIGHDSYLEQRLLVELLQRSGVP
jgi:hypothetical protein